MVILKKIMQNKKEADPDGAEGWDRKKKTGNVWRADTPVVVIRKKNARGNFENIFWPFAKIVVSWKK